MKIVVSIILMVVCIPLFIISAIYKDDDVLLLDDNEKDEVEANLEKALQELIEREAQDINLDGKE